MAASPATTDAMVYDDAAAPAMLDPFLRHWYVRPAPDATTLNVAGDPMHAVWFEGCVVMLTVAQLLPL